MKKIILLAIITLGLSSCSPESITDSSNQVGKVYLNLDKANTPDDVVLIRAELQSEKFENQENEIAPQSSNSSEIYFDKVEAGNWEIEISAYNSDETLIYFGSSKISVTDGDITVVAIELSRVAGSSTGSVYIFVTWNDNIFNSWIDYPANPILEKQNNSLDYKGICPSSVVKVDDHYIMWYSSLSGSSSHIYAATSKDGLNWTPYSTEPVFSPDPTSTWDNRNVSGSTVIIEDGLFKMYYTGRSSAESTYSPWYVGLAVSTDGFNWERRKNPVFSGAIGEWDIKIAASDIRIIDGTYYMYYTGKTELNDHQIGIATSYDGINWVRNENNPILSSSQTWEGPGCYFPTILKVKDLYHMVYMNSASGISGFGYATSSDGLNWVKNESNPFITSNETYKKWERILYPFIIELEDEYRIYYTGANISEDDRTVCVLRSFK